MYAILAAQFTLVNTADILVKDFIPTWGCPKSLPSNHGRDISPELLLAVCKPMGMWKMTTSVYHPRSYDGKERVNHTMRI